MPFDGPPASRGEEIVFTEEQYYLAAQDAYSWSNLIQLQRMSSSVGLIVGMSLEDRNLRRLLDAAMRSPMRSENYLLIREPQWKKASDEELDEMHHKAIGYLKLFSDSGVKKSGPTGLVADKKPGIKPGDVNIPGVKSGATRFDGTKGVKGPLYRSQISRIIAEVERLDAEQRTYVLEQLGVHPIWYKEHSEIPQIIAQITRPARAAKR